jgi:hypothetical protein
MSTSGALARAQTADLGITAGFELETNDVIDAIVVASGFNFRFSPFVTYGARSGTEIKPRTIGNFDVFGELRYGMDMKTKHFLHFDGIAGYTFKLGPLDSIRLSVRSTTDWTNSDTLGGSGSSPIAGIAIPEARYAHAFGAGSLYGALGGSVDYSKSFDNAGALLTAGFAMTNYWTFQAQYNMKFLGGLDHNAVFTIRYRRDGFFSDIVVSTDFNAVHLLPVVEITILRNQRLTFFAGIDFAYLHNEDITPFVPGVSMTLHGGFKWRF